MEDILERGEINMETNNTNTDFHQAMTCFAQGDYEKCIDELSSALKDNPEDVLGYLTRGVAYMKIERADSALGDFDKAIEIKPEHFRAHHLRGLAFSSLGEHDKALSSFDKAIELNPEYGAAYLSRANLHEQMGHDEQAEEDMDMVGRLQQLNVHTYADAHNVLTTKDSGPSV